MNKAISKFKDKYKNEPQIDHVIDYLKSEYGNKKFINFNYKQALEKANLWIQKLNEKNKGLKSSGKVEIIKDFGSGFRIVRLIDQESKDWEGLHMRHCVSSYKDHEGIYSLRDSNNFPHCSIETNGDKIQQIKGKANGRVSPKYVDFVLYFLQSLNFELSKFDIINLGYVKNVDLSFIKEHFTNYKIIKIRNEEFFYVGNKLKLIKNFDSKDKNLLFHFCKYNQCFDAVKLLIENGANIHTRDDYPIVCASQNGHLGIVKFLVENGANVHAQDNISLIATSANGHLDVVKFLVEKGANIHAQDNISLIATSANGHLDVVKFLVENGVNVHSRDDDSLRCASQNGHLGIVKFLVENGANVHVLENFSLRWASLKGHLDVVKFLIENGADIHSQEDSSLCWASQNGHLDVVKFLVENGADIHAQEDFSLRYASANGHLDVVKFLNNQFDTK